MSLKEKTTKGIFWSFIDQFLTQGIGFIIGIIIARILCPSDYGIIGMLSIFIAIANTFINSGFGTALIQKNDRTQIDFSTVFFFNLGTAILLYLLLFILAPVIAAFYKIEELTLITRIIGLNLIIGAFAIVPRTILNINIDFKTQTKVSVVSIVFSGIIGIIMAFNQYGVWALIAQSIISTILQTILFIYFIKWRPIFEFSKQSFHLLFGYGSKILLATLIDTVYTNILSLVIGKRFSAKELGYYTRAQQMESFPSANVTAIIQRVTFPILCDIQDDQSRLIDAYRKLIKMTSFIIFPFMFLLVLVANPLITILLTDKWLPAVELFQILCFSGMWYPIHAINLSLLQANGNVNLFVKLEIWKKSIGFGILIITLPFGLKTMLWGQVIISFIALFINTWYTDKIFNYGFIKQIKDIIIYLLVSISVCFLLSQFGFYDSNWYKLIGGGLFYLTLYIGITWLLKSEELKQVKILLFSSIKHYWAK